MMLPHANLSADLIRLSAGRAAKIVFVHGNFNVVHPGHLRLLKFAAEIGDYLVVGINPDGSPGATLPADDRLEAVRCISFVDHTVLLDEGPERFLETLRPAFVVKGKEFEHRENPEQAILDSYGGKLLFSSGEMRFSSNMLLQSEYDRPHRSTIRLPTDFPKRHGFTIAGLKTSLSKLAGIRTLVIGDLIIDDYITCDPIGMSQEDPTIVVTPLETKTFVGGAGVVAAHANGLGADVQFCTVVGPDALAQFARDNLEDLKVMVSMFVDESRPTTRKQRFRALNKTLLRVNHLRQHPIGAELCSQILADVEARLATTDLILFSDFNYGCLPQALVDAIRERAAEKGVMMAADSQASSQMADISRFRGMVLITPTEREARLALHDFDSGLAVISDQLQRVSQATTVVITLGSEGLVIQGRDQGGYVTDRLGAFNTLPKDVAGAGDSLFTCMSLGLRAGLSEWESVYLGSVAAAAQVARVGNAPLRLTDLAAELDPQNFFPEGG